MHTWTWFALSGGCAVLEILNLSLVFASFAVGAAGAGFASLAGANMPAQWVTLALATVLSLRLKLNLSCFGTESLRAMPRKSFKVMESIRSPSEAKLKH